MATRNVRPLDGVTKVTRIGRLDEVALSVLDLGKMTQFYKEVLEFREVFQHEGRMVGLDTGAAMLVLKASSHRSAGVALSLSCANIDAALRKITRRGVTVSHPLTDGHWGDRYAGFEDPEGNTIYLEGPPKRGHHHHSTGMHEAGKTRPKGRAP